MFNLLILGVGNIIVIYVTNDHQTIVPISTFFIEISDQKLFRIFGMISSQVFFHETSRKSVGVRISSSSSYDPDR